MARQLTIDTMYFPTQRYILASPAYSTSKHFISAYYETYTERGNTYTQAGLAFNAASTVSRVTPLVSIPRSHFDQINMTIF